MDRDLHHRHWASTGWNQGGTEVLAQVLDNESRLGDSKVSNRDDGRFSKQMNYLELRRSTLRFGITLIGLDFVHQEKVLWP
jgi:hypothetical protein